MLEHAMRSDGEFQSTITELTTTFNGVASTDEMLRTFGLDEAFVVEEMGVDGDV